MAWRGYDMNIAHVIVFAISLGVAVDNTIHFVSRFREELQTGHTAVEAVCAALQHDGSDTSTSGHDVHRLGLNPVGQHRPLRRF